MAPVSGVLGVEDFIDEFMRQNMTPEDLIGRLTRDLLSLDRFLASTSQPRYQNAARACIAYSRMLYNFGQMMFSARAYLLNKIKILETKERDLNQEISFLRNPPSDEGDELSDIRRGELDVSTMSAHRNPDPSEEETLSLEHSTMVLDREIILSGMDKSQRSLCNLSEAIVERMKSLQEIEIKMVIASNDTLGDHQCEGDAGNSPPTILWESIKEPTRPPRSERTGDCDIANRSRGGVPRSQTRSINDMAMNKEQELTIEDFGPSDQHDGAVPGAVGSSTYKGNPCMEAASVHGEHKATDAAQITEDVPPEREDMEIERTSQDDGVEEHAEVASHATPLKRKAHSSPEINFVCEEFEAVAGRPTKARIIIKEAESRESSGDRETADKDPLAISISSEHPSSSEGGVFEGDVASGRRSPSFEESRRLTRSQAAPRGMGSKAFEKLARACEEKRKRAETKGDRRRPTAIIDSDSEEVPAGRSGDDSYSDRKGAISRSRRESSRDIVSDKSGGKRKKNYAKTKPRVAERNSDKLIKTPLSRGKNTIPQRITRDVCDSHIARKREDWLKMSGPELGAHCLDHLAEIERQRLSCGNLAGRVDGMLKGCGQAASNIVRAMVERIDAAGDVIHLRTMLTKATDELEENKRTVKRQDDEIKQLRRTIISLERRLNSIEAGHGPYFPVRPATSSDGRGCDLSKADHMSGKRAARGFADRRTGKSSVANGGNVASAAERPRVSEFTANTEDWPNGPDSMEWNPSDIRTEEANQVANRGRMAVAAEFSGGGAGTRKDVKIIENRQLVPPRSSRGFPALPDTAWTPVEDRSKRRKRTDSYGTPTSGDSRAPRGGPKRPPPPPPTHAGPPTRPMQEGGGRPATFNSSRNRIIKFSKPAVVTITTKGGEGTSYADILSKAKQKVSLGNLGIENVRMRRAMNGALVIEIPGPDGKALANSLRRSLEEVLEGEATVSNPVPMEEIRLRGLDLSTTVEDIRSLLVDVAKCSSSDLKVSPISRMRDGMGIAWVHCPLEYAVAIAAVGRITIGWTAVRLELLKKRPVQCFRCWRFGHVRNNCRSAMDRTGLCFRCGGSDHSVRDCAERLRCLVCVELKKEHAHRLGSPRCLENQGFSTGIQTVGRRNSSIIPANSAEATRDNLEQH